MSNADHLPNRVKLLRQQRGWSQDELARRAGISRPAVSAIEIQRLVPSVAAALALASVLECRVEDLFGTAAPAAATPTWAWPPTQDPCRYWHARVRQRNLLFPAEITGAGVIAHDGVFQNGTFQPRCEPCPENTLVMASCDPAASLLASAYSQTSKFRLLVLPRASRQALELLKDGLVDVAGIHLTSAGDDEGNAAVARSVLGTGYSMLRAATWQEGLAVASGVSAASVQELLGSRVRWVGRAPGSGARQCQDEVLEDRPQPRRHASDHRGVAEAIRAGWADVGVCVRLVCDEAGLQFIKLRDEPYDLCFPTDLEQDPRMRTLLQLVRSEHFRACLSDLPGYDGHAGGEVLRI